MSVLKQGGSTFSGINVTPLTDVMLVLLITFLLTASSFQETLATVPLPKVLSAKEVSTQMTVLNVELNGELLWPAEFRQEQLSDKERFARLKELSGQQVLGLAIHRELPYERLFEVLEQARAAGWVSIKLLTEVET